MSTKGGRKNPRSEGQVRRTLSQVGRDLDAHSTSIGTAQSRLAELNERAHADQAAVTLTSDPATISGLSFSAVPTQGELEAMRDATKPVADDVTDLRRLVNRLREDLVAQKLIKGGA